MMEEDKIAEGEGPFKNFQFVKVMAILFVLAVYLFIFMKILFLN